MEKRLILASSSPRRREILKDMGLEFEIVTSNFEENLDSFDFSYEKIEQLAFLKAKSVWEKVGKAEHYLILSADTVVVLNNQIMCKPKDKPDAINMLNKLSGKTHSVVTSICVIDTQTNSEKILSTTSYVQFKRLPLELITYYVKTFNPTDKAGAYGIQELPDGFVNKIEGSFENIIGLCPIAVKEILNI